ncbi:GDSL-type esterase/lipase family protein [Kribbella deserti]|uniref:GDSL-type esterase/lipase family protein n=1 Tax=Kribbella deserti TaxID=1926257 RepID=A0ABV6QPD6_9ACTN
MRALVKAVPVAVAAAALVLNVSPPQSSLQSAASSGQQAAAAAPAVPLVRATPTKVMPIGDSNTGGADAAAGGYRTDLWQLLRADGRPVDFVGSLRAGSAALGDHDHEGHGGWTIQGIHDSVAGWLQTYQPDVVTLQIGTNDMYDDTGAGLAPGRLSALLDRITQTAPNARVFVTSIPPTRIEADQRRTQAFNAAIPGIVAAKVAAGKQIGYVDTGTAYVAPFDLMDNVHPYYGAASRAAVKWYAALTDQTVSRYEAEQTANAAITHAVRTTITSASGNGKVGYIDFDDSAVVFTVQVGAAGNYRVRARGANGMGTTCSHRIAANNGPQQPVVYPSYSWDLFHVTAVDVPLNAGTNTIRFTKGDCYTELDAIDLSPTPTA